jgi:hypothetical protein
LLIKDDKTAKGGRIYGSKYELRRSLIGDSRTAGKRDESKQKTSEENTPSTDEKCTSLFSELG